MFITAYVYFRNFTLDSTLRTRSVLRNSAEIFQTVWTLLLGTFYHGPFYCRPSSVDPSTVDFLPWTFLHTVDLLLWTVYHRPFFCGLSTTDLSSLGNLSASGISYESPTRYISRYLDMCVKKYSVA